MYCRERTIWTRTDTSIRVYTTADTDTDTIIPCVGVPATCIIRQGRSFRERSLYAMGGTYRPLATNLRIQSVLWHNRNVRLIDSWLLLSLPAGGGSAAWWWQRPVLRRLCNLISASPWHSHLPPPFPQPSPISWTIKQIARVRARRAGDGSLEPLWSSCVMRPVNSWWTCSDARNIGWYNSSRYDLIRYTQYQFRYDTDLIIVCSLIYWHVYN